MSDKMTSEVSDTSGSEESPLGKFLAAERVKAGLSLRQVEEATNKEVSNAYLSQLEKNKILKPSPNILHALSKTYGIDYMYLMEIAGYMPKNQIADRQSEVATFAIQDVTKEEGDALLKYLEFIRFQRKRP